MEEINVMSLLRCSSLVLSNPKFDFEKTDKSLTFVTLTPVLNGYIKTVKMITLKWQFGQEEKTEITEFDHINEENLQGVDNEKKELILINKSFCSKYNHSKLFKEREEFDII